MSDSNTSRRLLIDSLKKCNLLHHLVSLLKIGVKEHLDILRFDALFLAEATGIDIHDATTIINTVRNVAVQSNDLGTASALIKQEPIDVDSDSDIEIINSEIVSNDPKTASASNQEIIQNDASSNCNNVRMNSNNTTNNVNPSDANHFAPLSPQSHASSRSIDRIPHSTTSLSCPQCHQSFENEASLCAHAIASMQNNGCDVVAGSSQVSSPSVPSPSALLSEMRKSQPMQLNVDEPQSMINNVPSSPLMETTSLPNQINADNAAESAQDPVNQSSQTLLTQQSHVSVIWENDDDEHTEMDLNAAFDFDNWINENELNEIRHIFLKYGMINTQTISTQSEQFKNFITDHELLMNPKKMAAAIECIQGQHHKGNNAANTSWKFKTVPKKRKHTIDHEDADVSDAANTNNMETPMGDDNDNKNDINTDTEMDSNVSLHSESESETETVTNSKRKRGVMCYGCNEKFANVYFKSKHECTMGEISTSPPPQSPSPSPPASISPPPSPPVDSCTCSDCGKSFKNRKALGGHRSASKSCGNNKAIKTQHCKEEKVKTEHKTPHNKPIRQRKRKRKTTYRATYKNKDGSQRAPRLRLDEALEDTKLKTEWSNARKRAWENKDRKPEGYYYRFNEPGEKARFGKWDKKEHELFIQKVKEIGVNAKWGSFSQAIPGRVGYMCSGYWRKLINKKLARDQNYYYNATERVMKFKWTKGGGNELLKVKKWSFSLLNEDGDIIYDKERDNFQVIEDEFRKYLHKEYIEQMEQPPTKKRKISDK